VYIIATADERESNFVVTKWQEEKDEKTKRKDKNKQGKVRHI
jgi:hypothetical protein